MALVAPEIFTPPFAHWYVGVGLPEAATVKDAVPPVVTVWFDGCVVIAGATAEAETVRTAPVLVAEPAEFVATAV